MPLTAACTDARPPSQLPRAPTPAITQALLRLVALASCAMTATATTPAPEARYAEPTQRYGHFALGPPHEYAQIRVAPAGGTVLTLALPPDEVFEDLAPRPVRRDAQAPQEWLTVLSHRERGAQLALVGVVGGQLQVTARAAPIGRPMRWLNPIGAADLDGDGRIEFAAVLTPHIGGTLTVYRALGDRLVEVAALAGFSNHEYGSPELGLSLVRTDAGRTRMLVPDRSRTRVRVIALVADRLVETGSCALPRALLALRRGEAGEVLARLDGGGTVTLNPDCLR